jgi:DNA-binding NarL/FixJ family response regulator
VVRVYVVDDHAVVREGLGRIIQAMPDLELAGSAADARAALTELRGGVACDVLVLDLSLPGGGGFELLDQLQAIAAQVKVVVYSMYPEEQYGPRLLRAGARAYLSKSRSIDEVLLAIRRVAGGGRYITDLVAERLLEPASSTVESLSAREHQVLLLVVEGMQTNAIAAELCISASTVSTHLRRVKDKLGARSSADLVRLAFREGLVE